MQSDSVSTITPAMQATDSSQRIGQPTPTDFWETAYTLGLPAALWRLPNQRHKHLIVSFDETLPRVSADLEELPAGFLISPFDNLNTETETPAQTLFLRADVQAVFSENAPTATSIADTEAGNRFQQTITRRTDNQRTDQEITFVTLPDNGTEQEYLTNVADAVESMQRGEFRKVVLARTKQLCFSDAPNAVALFDKLCQKYPTAFVSAVSIPEKGQIWISATPERLVSVDAAGIFRTNALAGTQSAFEADGTPKLPQDAMWSQKEIEEQAIVCRYIIECFKKIRLREYIEEGPQTVIAGNLMHLGTSFTVDTQAVRYPQLGTVMLRLLHPTSAVCGTPRDLAFSFIKQHESYDREFYSGFLGPVNISTNDAGPASDLFVHIRCMKLEGNLATLYAGAGLTEYSIPEREWQETEMKCQTLLSVIQ
jgi:isochorismate synthase